MAVSVAHHQNRLPGTTGAPTKPEKGEGMSAIELRRIRSGRTLLAVMEQEGVAVQELADYARCSPAFISHLRTGRRELCNADLADRIATYLGVGIELLFADPVPTSGTKNAA